MYGLHVKFDHSGAIMGLFVTILILCALIIYLVMIYNGLVGLRNQAKNAFSQIDVQLQRRYDLIPNLVEVARKYMQHERETLEAIIEARNTAKSAAQKAAENQADNASMTALQGAEGRLEGVLSRFFALSEAYPDLKANQNMVQLHEELISTENRIAFARQAYNDSVMFYNIKRESFPDGMIANSCGFRGMHLWQAANTDIQQPVNVRF